MHLVGASRDSYTSYIFIAVVEHHQQDNLKNNMFNWICTFRGLARIDNAEVKAWWK